MESKNEELPTISLISPKQKTNRKSFQMPNASFIAAQRKLEMEQDNILKEKIENNMKFKYAMDADTFPSEIKGFENTDENSNNEECLRTAIESLNSEDMIDYNGVDLNGLKSKFLGNITILIENPGIEISQLIIHDPDLSHKQMSYLEEWFKNLEEYKTSDNFESYLNNCLTTFEDKLNACEEISSLEKIYAISYFIIAVMLDRELRTVICGINIVNILWLFLHKISIKLKTSSLIFKLSQKIVNVYKHFHDRLYIAMSCVRVHCDPTKLEQDPEYFGNMLGKYILLRSVLDMSGYDCNQDVVNYESFTSLKDLIIKSDKISSSGLYEQFILMKTVYVLSDFLAISPKMEDVENETKKALIQFFSSMINKHPKSLQKNNDICKMKILISEIQFLWLKKFHSHSTS